MTVKELVKVICEKRGLSTPQLAEGAEINPNTLLTVSLRIFDYVCSHTSITSLSMRVL